MARVKDSLPPLPQATRARLLDLGLPERDVEVLMTIDAEVDVGFDGEPRRGAVAYFDDVSKGRNPKVVVNWFVTHRALCVATACLILTCSLQDY